MTLGQLEDLIIKASTIYYTGQFEGVKYDSPILTDKQFDQYVRWLKSVSPNSRVFRKAGWGYDPNTVPGDKVSHIHGGMGSIDNKPRDFKDIPDKLKHDVRISAKLDGLSGKLEIVDGKFVRCTTRGNGEVGIDKTDKMQELLKRYGDTQFPKDFTGEIRGEFVISQQNWNILSAQGKYNKHARNAASGIVNADDITEDIKYLDFIPYKVLWDKNNTIPAKFASDLESCVFCQYMPGFPHLPWMHRDKYSSEDLVEAYTEWMATWPIDGVVISSDNIEVSSDGTRIYDEVAFKFESLKCVTTVKSIDWQVGKSCKLTPVANLEPVDIDGATIERVTLHNARNVVNTGIVKGSQVEIMRSGGVIPWLTQVVSNPEGSEVVIPDKCEVCGSSLVWRGVDIVCSNELCGNVNMQDLKVWIHCLGMVDGIADTSIFQYLERYHIDSIDSLYAHDLSEFEGISSESVMAGKFYKVVSKLFSSPVKLAFALQALNIPRMGEVTSKKLSSDNKFVDELRKNLETDTIVTDNLVESSRRISGDATADSIVKNSDKFNKLRFISSRLIYPDIDDTQTSSEINGIIAITGKLSMPRKKFEALISSKGYVIKDDVTKKTNYLVTNESEGTSSKHKRAAELDIPKISESEFLELIGVN